MRAHPSVLASSPPSSTLFIVDCVRVCWFGCGCFTAFALPSFRFISLHFVLFLLPIRLCLCSSPHLLSSVLSPSPRLVVGMSASRACVRRTRRTPPLRQRADVLLRGCVGDVLARCRGDGGALTQTTRERLFVRLFKRERERVRVSLRVRESVWV